MRKELDGKVETLVLGTVLFNSCKSQKKAIYNGKLSSHDAKQFWILKGQADGKKKKKIHRKS